MTAQRATLALMLILMACAVYGQGYTPIGPRGATGSQGPAGAMGATGPQGPQGANADGGCINFLDCQLDALAILDGGASALNVTGGIQAQQLTLNSGAGQPGLIVPNANLVCFTANCLANMSYGGSVVGVNVGMSIGNSTLVGAARSDYFNIIASDTQSPTIAAQSAVDSNVSLRLQGTGDGGLWWDQGVFTVDSLGNAQAVSLSVGETALTQIRSCTSSWAPGALSALTCADMDQPCAGAALNDAVAPIVPRQAGAAIVTISADAGSLHSHVCNPLALTPLTPAAGPYGGIDMH